MENGFSGQSKEKIPTLTDEFVTMVSERYIELYEKVSGKKFKKAASGNPIERIEKQVNNYLRDNIS